MNYLQKELYRLVENDPDIFDFIQRTSLDGLWYWDLESPENEWMNETFWETLGYDPAQMPHKASAWQDIINKDDLKLALQKFQAHCEDPNIAYDQIVRYRHSEGHTVWIRCKGVVIRNDEGKPVRMLGSHIDISRQKEMQLELADKVYRYNQIIASSEIGTWEWNISTDEFIHNDQWLKIFGYKEESDLSPADFWRTHLHPDDVTMMEDKLLCHLKGDSPIYQVEARIKTRKEEWKWILVKGQVIDREEDGRATWTRGSIIDISDRKQNEILLAQYQDLLARANDVARIGTWEYDIANGQLFWSKVTYQIHEVPEGQIPSIEEAYKFYPPGKDREVITEAVKRAIEEGKGYDEELKIQTQTGKLRWVRAVGIPEMRNGTCTRLYGLFQDIHESKEYTIQLALQEELFRQTFDRAPSGMVLVDNHFKVIQLNKTACDILGYSRDDVKGKGFTEVFQPCEANGERFDPFVQSALHPEKRECEVQLKHKNGPLIWVSCSLSKVNDVDGGIKHYVYQFNDITKIKKAQERIDNLLSQTQKKNQQLLNFANIVSHNLRSNSSNLMMFLDLLNIEENAFINDELYPMLEEAVEGLQSTIANLQEVVDIQTKDDLELKKLNMKRAVEAAIGGVRAVGVNAGVDIKNEVSPSHQVQVVPAYLDSILTNLITNGIKYRSPDKKAYVSIRSQKRGDGITLTVEDNGLGMDMDLVKDKLFGMYKTFHGNADARGLGLFLVKSQVEAMGGEIGFESAVGVGTKFNVSLHDG